LKENNAMKTYHKATLAMLVGLGLCAAAVPGLHAQTKPLIYYIIEIELTNPDAYAKEFAPKAQAIIKGAGGRFLAVGGAAATGAKPLTGVEGDPPKRVVVLGWDSMEKIRTWWTNPEYVALRKVGDKYAKFRSYFVGSQ
jgi:uncharacterized protein (DUF1330 family)